MKTKYIQGGPLTEETNEQYKSFKKAVEKFDPFSGVRDGRALKQEVVGVYYGGNSTIDFEVTTDGVVSGAYLLPSPLLFTQDMVHEGVLAPRLCNQVLRSLTIHRRSLSSCVEEKV